MQTRLRRQKRGDAGHPPVSERPMRSARWVDDDEESAADAPAAESRDATQGEVGGEGNV
eukprot:SAG31_NODE_1284_length_9010_cov_56.116934_4_plen_59_part_00